MADKIQLQTNIMEELVLKFPTGREMPDNGYGPSVMFSATDGRVLFVPPQVAQEIQALQLAPGEPFHIGKVEQPLQGGRKRLQWHIARVHAPGQFQQQASPSANGGAPPPAPGFTGQPATPTTAPQRAATQMTADKQHNNGNGAAAPPSLPFTGPEQTLYRQTTTAIDVYAKAVQYAAQEHGGMVKAEDVRALLQTMLINYAKSGGAL